MINLFDQRCDFDIEWIKKNDNNLTTRYIVI